MLPPSSGSKNKPIKNSLKAGDKHSNRLAKISDCIENRSEMEDSKSPPVGSPVGQNETLEPTGSHTQPSEPIGGKNRRTSTAVKSAICVSPGKDTGEVAKMLRAENRGINTPLPATDGRVMRRILGR
jgi:hypothetical protein